jgi:hypothetical protein
LVVLTVVEQQAIAAHVGRQTAEIDRMVANLEEASGLRKYRAR